MGGLRSLDPALRAAATTRLVAVPQRVFECLIFATADSSGL